jgi:hypothetical protein
MSLTSFNTSIPNKTVHACMNTSTYYIAGILIYSYLNLSIL